MLLQSLGEEHHRWDTYAAADEERAGTLAMQDETFADRSEGTDTITGPLVGEQAQTRTDMGELLRVIGFSYAPHFFSIFGVLPGVGVLIRLAVNLWLLATTVVAVRQALDYRSTFRAFRVVVVGWLIFVAIAWAAGEGYPP